MATIECLTNDAFAFTGIPRCCTPFFQLKTLMQAESGTICPRTGRLLSGARAGELPKFHGKMWWTNGQILMNQGGISGLWRGACPLVVRGALLASGQMLGYDGLKTYCKREAIMTDGPALHVAASIAAAFFSCSFSAPVRYKTNGSCMPRLTTSSLERRDAFLIQRFCRRRLIL
jgi:hypothetical protein